MGMLWSTVRRWSPTGGSASLGLGFEGLWLGAASCSLSLLPACRYNTVALFPDFKASLMLLQPCLPYHDGHVPSETINQSQTFFCNLLSVRVFYHSNGKVTNIEVGLRWVPIVPQGGSCCSRQYGGDPKQLSHTA